MIRGILVTSSATPYLMILYPIRTWGLPPRLGPWVPGRPPSKSGTDLIYLSLTKPTMQQRFHPSVKHLLYRYITPSCVGHSFRVEGETWYFFANSPLCILT